jgi:hypothetical protein
MVAAASFSYLPFELLLEDSFNHRIISQVLLDDSMQDVVEGFVLGELVGLDLQIRSLRVRGAVVEIPDDLAGVLRECWEEREGVCCFGCRCGCRGGSGGWGEEVVVEWEGVCGITDKASLGRC